MPKYHISLVLKELQHEDTIIPIKIDQDYNFLDLIMFLVQWEFNKRRPPIIESGIVVGNPTVIIKPDNLNQKLVDYIQDDIVNIKELGIFTPKNDFIVIGNILGLYYNNLIETVNIMDVCSINHAKLGEWIGFGRGPTTVPVFEDNMIRNLIFIRFGMAKPVAYNIHCLNRMVDINSNSLLIPHINKKVVASKFNELFKSRVRFKILNLNNNDIVLY